MSKWLPLSRHLQLHQVRRTGASRWVAERPPPIRHRCRPTPLTGDCERREVDRRMVVATWPERPGIEAWGRAQGAKEAPAAVGGRGGPDAAGDGVRRETGGSHNSRAAAWVSSRCRGLTPGWLANRRGSVRAQARYAHPGARPSEVRRDARHPLWQRCEPRVDLGGARRRRAPGQLVAAAFPVCVQAPGREHGSRPGA